MSIKINWDALGITTSVACAIHCAVLPLVVTSLPVFGVNIVHNSLFEYGMIALAFAVGLHALLHGYRKHHHNRLPLVLFSISMLCLLAKQVWHGWEIGFLIPAVTGIVAAHYLNYRLDRSAAYHRSRPYSSAR
ncbi:MAG: MerC domain-containing protein [Williamsia sp.]|nr:MerC domain-containing protein [Williamsia sp.]